MEFEFEIEECTENDIDTLSAMEQICFSVDAWSRESFAEAFKSGSFIVLKMNDLRLSKIIGYSLIYYALDQADLANIAILPTYRGRKLGRVLLDKTLEKVNEKGVSEVFLEVRESNAAARRLYLSSGFVEIGKRKKYYVKPKEDAVLMVKVLKGI